MTPNLNFETIFGSDFGWNWAFVANQYAPMSVSLAAPVVAAAATTTKPSTTAAAANPTSSSASPLPAWISGLKDANAEEPISRLSMERALS